MDSYLGLTYQPTNAFSLSGEPVMFEAREMVLEDCEDCRATVQHRALRRHMTNQHTNVLNFTPPSLYSPSPARRAPRHFDVTWNPDDGMMECPVPLCQLLCHTMDRMRSHFHFRHYDQGLSFNRDTRSYEKCELCMKYIQPTNEAQHQRTVLMPQGKRETAKKGQDR
jgi:hypothetical protein